MKLNRKALLVSVLFATGAISPSNAGTPNVVLWDTSSPLGEPTNTEDRTSWRVVPSDLLTLEADPPKASSDPGYYGRDYSFNGDAIVENRNIAAVLVSAQGRVVFYSKTNLASAESDWRESHRLGTQIAEISPLQATPRDTVIRRFEILRNAEDEVLLQV